MLFLEYLNSSCSVIFCNKRTGFMSAVVKDPLIIKNLSVFNIIVQYNSANLHFLQVYADPPL